MKVALFITCLTDQFYPRVGEAVVKVLQHLGCEVSFPPDQTCCGQPQFNNGFHRQARKMAQNMIQVFSQSPVVVTPSGSCAAMIRGNYESLFSFRPDWSRRARDFAGKTYEFMEFLVKVLKVKQEDLQGNFSGTMTYHYSCHLRGVGMGMETADLLQHLEGIDFVPLERANQCCGFGGTFSVKHPEISRALVYDKVACIRETKVQTVVMNDAGCTLNISGACRRMGVGVQFKHIAEVLAEGLGLMENERFETANPPLEKDLP